MLQVESWQTRNLQPFGLEPFMAKPATWNL